MTNRALKYSKATWHPNIKINAERNQFEVVANYYEQLIEEDPANRLNYWLLGLAHILNHDSDSAFLSWFACFAEAPENELSSWVEELVEVLELEAIEQAERKNHSISLDIRFCIHHFNSQNISNLFQIILIEDQLQILDPPSLEALEFSDCLNGIDLLQEDQDTIDQVMVCLLKYPCQTTLDFADRFVSNIHNNKDDCDLWIERFLESGAKNSEQKDYGAGILDLVLKLGSKETRFWKSLAIYHHGERNFSQAVEAAENFLSSAHDLPTVLRAYYLLLTILGDGSMWHELNQYISAYFNILDQVLTKPLLRQDLSWALLLISTPSLLQYFDDDLVKNRFYQNRLSSIAQKLIEQIYPPISINRKSRELAHKLKIGFIGHTFRVHSVGWLFRWTYQYLDRESFQINLYMVDQDKKNSFSANWFNNPQDKIRYLDKKSYEIAQIIAEDKVDILIDLDSNSYTKTCTVLALKPSPIQVSWMGYDACGLPSIDYFLADEKVLPYDAGHHYQEKIWRLPNTYLAIEGFEVDVPTIRRSDLEIPNDAIIYLSAQSGFKRKIETIRLQLKILKQVPNSYFLVKSGGDGDQDSVKDLFHQIAQEEGISIDCLRFLNRDENEFIHRANLKIADIILDTYPYNGATTTLEALWMEIPIVTKVGQQFAARNSYTFLSSVGVNEGISFTDEEYISWGVKLGLDSKLREQVIWKLKRSKQNSPLWNTKKFTQNLEEAFGEMWNIHCHSEG